MIYQIGYLSLLLHEILKMGLFNKLFSSQDSSSKETSSTPQLSWLKLTRVEQLPELQKQSNEKLVVIFKHSTRCGISRMVWNQFQASADFPSEEVVLYYLDLLAYRDVSDAVAEQFQVYHQSPQLIILQHEEVVHHASHSAIIASSVNSFLNT